MTRYRQPCNIQIKQYHIDSDWKLKHDVTPNKSFKKAFKAGKMNWQGRNWICPFKKAVDNKHPEDLTEPVGLLYNSETLILLTS